MWELIEKEEQYHNSPLGPSKRGTPLAHLNIITPSNAQIGSHPRWQSSLSRGHAVAPLLYHLRAPALLRSSALLRLCAAGEPAAAAPPQRRSPATPHRALAAPGACPRRSNCCLHEHPRPPKCQHRLGSAYAPKRSGAPRLQFMRAEVSA
jgi:hypothetical protein